MAESGESGIRTMHPAPSLGEAPPVDFTRTRLEYDLKSLVSDVHTPAPSTRGTMFENREPERFSTHDTNEPGQIMPPLDSATKNRVRLTSAGLSSVEPTSTLTNIEAPRTPLKSPAKAVIQNGRDLADERRTPKGARRRTGPLNKEQRIKAAIIRKIGACQDCRRRRVSCDPAHHGETWDSAIAKYGFDVPDAELLPIGNPRDSVCSSLPTIASGKGDSEASDLVSPPASAGLYQFFQGKEFESTPERTEHRRLSPGVTFESSPTSSKSSDTQPPQKKRKPLPGSRRDRVVLHGTAQAAHSSPAIFHNRYKAVHALHLRWADESRQDVIQAEFDLEKTLRDTYKFSYQTELMPLGFSQEQLKNKIQQFIGNEDERDLLKIILYTGESYLDGDSMMLAAPGMSNRPSYILWNRVQLALEDAVADILLIMDCPYWTPLASKRHGVLEILACCTSEDSRSSVIPQGFFAKAVSRKLEDRAAQSWRDPPYVCNIFDLKSHLAVVYRNHIREMRHSEQRIRNFPAPFHTLIASQSARPTSIQLAPRSQAQAFSQREGRRAEPQIITLSFDSERDEDKESLNEWLRSRPESVRINTKGSHGSLDRTGPSSGFLPRAETEHFETEEKGRGGSAEVTRLL